MMGSGFLSGFRTKWLIPTALVALTFYVLGSRALLTPAARAGTTDTPAPATIPSDFEKQLHIPFWQTAYQRPADLYLTVDDLRAGKPTVSHVTLVGIADTTNGQEFLHFRTDQKTYLAIDARLVVAISTAR